MSTIAETFILEHIQKSSKYNSENISRAMLSRIIETYPQRFTRTVSHGKKTDTVLDEVIEEIYNGKQ